ncbi:MAG: putative histidine kinase, classic [Ramlibacter sp.]|nr:putative histidine kinase, classic [Ramlibacter sp.]
MSWRAWLQQSVRRKLLAMALLPTLLMLPLVLGALLWWGDIVYDKLLIAKVRSDLAVASGYFDQVVERVTAGTRAVADSQALLERLQRNDAGELDWFLEQQRRRLELDFLLVSGPTETLPRNNANGPGIASWDLQQLKSVSPDLHARVLSSPAGNPASRVLVIVSQTDVSDRGRRLTTVTGGILLNQNLELVDRINSIVYPEGALPLGSRGTTTLFMDDVRVSTNVRLFPNERAVGTHASPDVRQAVLMQGRTWLDRAYVVDAWYVSGYKPLLDVTGRRAGMLYVGYLEEPFRLAKWGILGLTGLIFLGGTLLTLFVSLRWAGTIFRPVERMNEVIRQVEQGARTARVGPIQNQDEIGRLAGQFDQLLDKVEDNRATLERWAHELEGKVATRARELASTSRSLHEAQRQLVQSEKLAAIGQVTAAMAHEINNPIAVMQGNLDLVRELLQEKTEIVAPELKLLDEQVERIRTMVSHLLRSARPSEYAGYVEALDAGAVMEESLVLSQHLLTSRVRIVRDYQATQRVEFNRQELQQLLVNLISNAVQAMPDGGCLTLRTCDWCGEGYRRGAIAEVQDTGTGIAPDIREQLFLPLFTTRRDGNGLGLWISLSLVERYGGSIDVENAEEGGAVFRVHLLSEALVRSPAVPEQG